MKNGKWTVWDSTLQAQLEISWKDNKKIGKVIHPSKKRKINESVIAIKDGERTEWYANGKPKSKKSYINGKRHGEWTYWYANGNKRLKSYYYYNRKDGKWAYHYSDGNNRISGTYKKGKKEGKWTIWYVNGGRE